MYRIILFILICSSVAAQDLNGKVDSLRLEQKFNLLLNNNSEINLPLFSIGEIRDPYELSFETNFLSDPNPSIMILNSAVMEKIKSNINNTLSIYRKGENKYNLGIASDILGYVVPAAAAGLAAYHVVKYKKHYGIK